MDNNGETLKKPNGMECKTGKFSKNGETDLSDQEWNKEYFYRSLENFYVLLAENGNGDFWICWLKTRIEYGTQGMSVM